MRHFTFLAVVILIIVIHTAYFKIHTDSAFPKDTIHIFFVVDDNYVKYLSVAMASILKNTKSPIFFTLLTIKLPIKQKQNC